MKPLEWVGGKIRFLDQTKLPSEELYCETEDINVLADAIRSLAIRGAPLIGIAAAYGIALASRALSGLNSIEIRKHMLSSFDLLASTRPTAINLFWALNRQRNVLERWQSNSIFDLPDKLLEEAKRIHQEDAEMCEQISTFGVQLLSKPSSILTHCNAGALATGGRGTALGIITKARETGLLTNVYMDETRPLLQGSRLTAWEMKQAGIPAVLITDNTAAFLMQKGKIDAVIVGADRIALNGDVANKVGTYNIAVLAEHHHIPFYVAAPTSTIDFQIQTGKEIPIEERDEEEVSTCFGKRIAPENVSIYSPAFDITPCDLISAIITNKGIYYPAFKDSFKTLQS